MTDKKRFVTARSATDGTHILIETEDPLNAFRTAQKLHRLGEHHYYQIRLRSTKPSLKSYRWVSLVKWIGA